MHKTTQDLQKFYDTAAESFSGTRKRHWPEFSYILDYIHSMVGNKKSITILELGCGDGRLLGFLKENTDYDITYTGVDISYNLLEIANQNHPDATWIHKDMCDYMKDIPQENFDCIIAIASFHHLPTTPQRQLVLDGIYSGLLYNGGFIMTNWCYSDRFKQKYKAPIRKAYLKSYLTLGFFNKDDIMVPWKNPQGELIADRLYHIFSQGELGKLITQSGFTNIKQVYITSTGEITGREADGRNLISSGMKSIYG